MMTITITGSRRLITGLLLLMTILSPLPAATVANLNGDWKFRLDPHDVGLKQGWEKPDFDDASWDKIKVPGPWPDQYDGVGWYRKAVELDAHTTAGAALKLIFEQVDDEGQVYVNGKLVATNKSWDKPFFADLSKLDLPTTGSGQKSLKIAVRVKDNGMAGGILQGVEIKDAVDATELYKSKWYDQTPRSTLKELGHYVMYSVYVRNFSPEGTFNALKARLLELKELGVNVLWLLPIHEIGAQSRKGPDGSPYAIKDYYSVDPALGTKEDFKALVQAAHAAGMKIIIDCVLNHTSPDSVLAREHKDWFKQDKDGNPTPANKDWSDIVDLDWKKHEVWDYCSTMLESWIRDYGIDGYRCDVADLMPGEFWTQLRPRLEKAKGGEVLMLAESEQPQKHLEGFDLTYEQDLRDTLIDIVKGNQSADALKASCMKLEYGNPKGSAAILFTENHDKPRAMKAFGGPEQTKAASVLMATLPGIPLLYTGTEVGASADRDDTFFKRSPVDFAHDKAGMRDFWKSLLALRAKHPALQTGDLKVLDASPAAQVFAFERIEGKDRVLVAVNLSSKEAHAKIEGQKPMTLKPWQWQIVAK